MHTYQTYDTITDTDGECSILCYIQVACGVNYPSSRPPLTIRGLINVTGGTVMLYYVYSKSAALSRLEYGQWHRGNSNTYHVKYCVRTQTITCACNNFITGLGSIVD